MKTLSIALMSVFVMTAAALPAEKAKESLNSGVAVGESVDAFYVQKCGGATDDGVGVGENLCYRCKLGNRPTVVVFARTADENLAKLAKNLDKTVAKNSDKKLGSFVNLLGDDSKALTKSAKDFAAKNKLEKVALVVPVDHKNGPKAYQIHQKADVTILVYTGGTVKANFALPAGGLTDKVIENVIAATDKMLN